MNQLYESEYHGYLLSLPACDYQVAVKQYTSGYTRFVQWRNTQAVKKFY